MHIPIDYPALRVIWWLLLGVLLTGFAITDGFDLGILILLPGVAKKDIERRVVINTIGPVWEGNQVWLVLGAGAIFAAWPDIYAITFSGFYFAMLLILFALILRPVGFKYRSKIDNATWRTGWDVCLFISGLIPTLTFGIAVGNVLQGIPFHYDTSLNIFYTGTLLGLFNPFALLTGLLAISLFIMHGGIFLANKTEDRIQKRATLCAKLAAVLNIIIFAFAGIIISKFLIGYSITSTIDFAGASNPLHKTVSLMEGAWINNYKQFPWMIFAPILGFAGAVFVLIFTSFRYFKFAWIASALCIIGIVSSVGFSMFPFILPSSSNPNMSLTVWDASSSQFTLYIMLICAIIFVPIILAYTSWVYRVMRGKVTEKAIQKNAAAY